MRQSHIFDKNELPESISLTKRMKDITNLKSGKLTALYPYKRGENRVIWWICKCDCGNYLGVPVNGISCNQIKSCGCGNRRRFKDLTGLKFGKLTVIEEIKKENNKNGYIYWKCKCDCGNETIVSTNNLQNSLVKSCGCLHSYGESCFQYLLSKNNIIFKREYKFEDLKDKTYLRFDFAIF